MRLLFLNLGHRIFGALPILYIGRFKGRKMNKFIPDRKNTTIIAFDKPISQKFSPNVRIENKISSHPLCLAMKYRLEIFVVKFISHKFFGRLLLS